VLNAGRERSVNHGIAIFIEVRTVQMAVGINHAEDSLETGSNGHIFEEAREYRLAAIV
jgi:hypothetical protein